MVKGSCLCGAIKWNYLVPIESATACNCTACRRYGTLWAYGYLDNEIKIEGATKGYKRTDKGILGFTSVPIDHFDGLETFDDLPHDGKCVKDLWF